VAQWWRRGLWQKLSVVVAITILASCACCSGGLIFSATPVGQAYVQEVDATSTAQTLADAQATATAYAYTLAHPSPTATKAAIAATTTPQPISTVTPKPTTTTRPTSTATPRPQPTATPVPYQLGITVTCADAVDYSYGEVCVHTHAGAQLTIVVTYCTGYTAKSASLQGTFTADSGGNYTWNWTPETKCHGQADAFITDNWNGQQVTTDPTFNVQ